MLLLPLVLVLAACPKDDEAAQPPVDSTALAPADTTPTDLSQVATALPPAAPDTFTVKKPEAPRTTRSSGGSTYPTAPSALMAAVQREQTFSKFCFQEFGQKSDPTLRGGVAMVVTVASSGISEASVANSNWTSNAGSAVNRCLNDKASQAWKLAPGEVKPGKYVVQLSFSGS
jgi:hypothetical protein